MPLSVNVGLSRKASKDYQSTGVSINVTAELDQALLARPQELQRQIDDLYAQAEAALDRHAGQPEAPPEYAGRAAADDNGGRAGNGRYARSAAGAARPRANGNGGGGGGGPMTESQRRAIHAIANRAGVDVEAECRDIVGPPLDELTLRQASEFIDHLKALRPAGNGRGR